MHVVEVYKDQSHKCTSACKEEHLLSLNDLNSEMRISSWGQGGEKHVGDH